jgi:hypothetical protein
MMSAFRKPFGTSISLSSRFIWTQQKDIRMNIARRRRTKSRWIRVQMPSNLVWHLRELIICLRSFLDSRQSIRISTVFTGSHCPVVIMMHGVPEMLPCCHVMSGMLKSYSCGIYLGCVVDDYSPNDKIIVFHNSLNFIFSIRGSRRHFGPAAFF